VPPTRCWCATCRAHTLSSAQLAHRGAWGRSHAANERACDRCRQPALVSAVRASMCASGSFPRPNGRASWAAKLRRTGSGRSLAARCTWRPIGNRLAPLQSSRIASEAPLEASDDNGRTGAQLKGSKLAEKAIRKCVFWRRATS